MDWGKPLQVIAEVQLSRLLSLPSDRCKLDGYALRGAASTMKGMPPQRSVELPASSLFECDLSGPGRLSFHDLRVVRCMNRLDRTTVLGPTFTR
jgi:hypothetical protein